MCPGSHLAVAWYNLEQVMAALKETMVYLSDGMSYQRMQIIQLHCKLLIMALNKCCHNSSSLLQRVLFKIDMIMLTMKDTCRNIYFVHNKHHMRSTRLWTNFASAASKKVAHHPFSGSVNTDWCDRAMKLYVCDIIIKRHWIFHNDIILINWSR